MPKILQLSQHVANLIAAGEVVERPASVVKELVENSLDAGARHITVELQNGGMTLLRVQDDGCGMAPDDAETAFLRHATSKIRDKNDLDAIGTLGFRGEALAATAAVSRIDLLTRMEGADEGVRLHLEAGKLLDKTPAGCPVGTTIMVRDLFYNTPARMKFMKTDKAESGAALAAVQKQALAHPECAFRLLIDGEERLTTVGDGQLSSAVYAVLGRQAALEMLPVESQWEKVRIDGFVSKPTATRGNRNYEIFFVNGRYVKSKLMQAALEEAYRNQMMVGRFPACVLNVTVPLSQVDVNVHPAKTEVKFLHERELFDCVHYGVLAALNRQDGRVAFQDSGFRGQVSGLRGQVSGVRDQGSGIKDQGAKIREQVKWITEPRELPRPSETVKAQAFSPATLRSDVMLPADGRDQGSRIKDQGNVGDGVLDVPPAQCPPSCHSERSEESVRQDSSSQAPQNDKEEQTSLPLETAPYRVVGEVLNTYIIVEQDDNVLLIDKHAAHERINFERLLAEGVQISGQLLLAPLTLELDPVDADALSREKTLLATLGYDFDTLGGGTLLLRQVPADLSEVDAVASLSEIAAHLQKGVKDSPETLRQTLLHTVACKAAIKGGWTTSEAEREYLAAQVLTRDDLKYCPHGRPIVVTLTKKQLEKQFKRQ